MAAELVGDTDFDIYDHFIYTKKKYRRGIMRYYTPARDRGQLLYNCTHTYVRCIAAVASTSISPVSLRAEDNR